MSGRKHMAVTLGIVCAVSLLAAALSALFTSHYDSRIQFELLSAVCGEVIEQRPETKEVISAVLKKYVDGTADETMDGAADENVTGNEDGNRAQEDILSALGYDRADFFGTAYRQAALFAAAGVLAGVLLFFFTFFYRNTQERKRIQSLADYLEQVNTGKASILFASGEDEFAKLEDEMYKTVTSLYQTRDAAIQAKNDFAENLSNIAHQIKTPITALSLSVQMLEEDFGKNKLERIRKQLVRLSRLEEALLILSRLDAGTLLLKKEETDVFTLLVLAADNLQEMYAQYGTSADIPELGTMAVSVDLDWTMEAIMNLMKNCMEHNKGGVVHCSYAQNPLYTEIQIWDEGTGFMKEDIPHLFERFYRGKKAGEGGIGIGLALSKEIIERQNGTIRAKNMPDAGACFEIHFYSH